MMYKFKVDVYRRTPYRGMMLAVAVLIGVPASIALLQKIDSLSPESSPARSAAPVQKIENLLPLPNLHLVKPTASFVFKKKAASSGKELKGLPLVSDKMRKLTCIFEGKATDQGVPSPDTTVLVKVSTLTGTQVRIAKTDAEGSYRIEVPTKTNIDDNLDWTIEAYTPEFKKVELVGRRIVTEDSTVSIEQTLAFLPH